MDTFHICKTGLSCSLSGSVVRDKGCVDSGLLKLNLEREVLRSHSQQVVDRGLELESSQIPSLYPVPPCTEKC